MKRSIVLLLATVLTSSAAGAATIHYQLTGTVDSVSIGLQSELSPGESVVVTFSAETEMRDGNPALGSAYCDAAGLTLTIGD